MWITLYACLNRQDGRDTPVAALSVKPNLAFKFTAIVPLQF